MKNSIKILVLILNLSYVWPKCDITLEDVDKCGFKSQFFGNRDVIIPANDADLDKHCSDIRTNIGCIRGFVNQCLDGMIKQTTEMVVNSAAKHLQKRCEDPKDREEFLTHVKCMSDKAKMEPFHICHDKNMVMMEMIFTLHGEEATGGGCCGFHWFQDCIRQRNKEICGEDTTDYWDQVLNDIAEDGISLSCGGYESLAKCEKSLNPKIWSEMQAISAINDPKELAARHTHQSGMALMIDFMKKLSKANK